MAEEDVSKTFPASFDGFTFEFCNVPKNFSFGVEYSFADVWDTSSCDSDDSNKNAAIKEEPSNKDDMIFIDSDEPLSTWFLEREGK